MAQLSQFATYEDYLDSKVSKKDLLYLQDHSLARSLVELGFRSGADVLKREDFERRKRELEEMKNPKASVNAKKRLAHEGHDLSQSPFLQAMAEREEDVRTGKLSTIVFIRDFNAHGHEISGYIDLRSRLLSEDFEQHFRGKKLLPRPSDLSFFDWETQTVTSTSSANFQVIADSSSGLIFKNKRDRKIISVDASAVSELADVSTRTELVSPEYCQVVIFDHLTRR